MGLPNTHLLGYQEDSISKAQDLLTLLRTKENQKKGAGTIAIVPELWVWTPTALLSLTLGQADSPQRAEEEDGWGEGGLKP